MEKDTDGDGVPDWEEGLYGTDPTNKETTPGIPDSTTIAKLKTDQGTNGTTTGGNNQEPENLTQTDKVSRQLFATVAATEQSGAMDQATADQISSSLADKIQNSAPRKVYALSDIKIINNDLFATTEKYSEALADVFKKYQVGYTILDVLQKFAPDENNVDTSALSKLDPIITQTNTMIGGMLKTAVPQSLAALHLEVINALERVVENISDIKLYDTDPVVALGGINQYETNSTLLESAVKNLGDMVKQKLNN